MRVHVDVLKLRAQCARCGQIGHWAKECQSQNDPDGKGRSKGAGVQSEKSGFRSRAHLILPTGHVAARVTEFPSSCWQVPVAAAHSCKARDFQLPNAVATPVFNYNFMSRRAVERRIQAGEPSSRAGDCGSRERRARRYRVSGQGGKLARRWLLAWISRMRR